MTARGHDGVVFSESRNFFSRMGRIESANESLGGRARKSETTLFDGGRRIVTRVGDVASMSEPHLSDEEIHRASQTTLDAAGAVVEERLGRAYDDFVSDPRDETWSITKRKLLGGVPTEITVEEPKTDAAYKTSVVTDGLDRVTMTVLADTHVTSTTYDEAGNVLSVRRPGLEEETATYDSRGLVTRTTRPGGKAVSYTYDALGNVKERTDEAGETTSYEVDGLGRLIKTIYLDGTYEETRYEDVTGQVAATRDRTGQWLSYLYDAGGRVVSVHSGAETTAPAVLKNEYDSAGRLRRVRNADAGTEYDDYDGLGRPRVTRTVRYMGGAGLDDPPPVSDVHVQRHVWTIHDERSEWTMPITGVEAPGSEVPSSPWLQIISETRDAGGNLTSQSGLGAQLLAAEARGVGRIESRDRYLTDGRPLTAVYGFADGKPLKEELAIPSSVPFAPATNTGLPAWSEMYVESTRIAGSANQRDDAMRMAASRELGMERFSAWSYDARGRLDQSWLNLRLPLGASRVDDSHLDADFRQMRTVAPRFSSFERDALEGEAAEIEPLSWTATRRSGDQIDTRTRSIGGVVVSPQLTYTYSGGRREADGLWTYSYDIFGRMKTATRGDRQIEYTWNPDDRLVGRTARRLVAEDEWQIESRAEVLASDGLPAATTFVWDPLVDRLVAVFVEGESTREGHPPQAGLLRQYLHGDQGYDDPTRVLIAAFADAPPETYFPLIDESGTGSVTAVLNGVGHLVERVLYADPYGDAPRYLHGPVVDRITTDVATNDEGAVAGVKIRVHLTERIAAASLAAGVRLATLRADDTIAAVSTTVPTLEDDFTILWEVPAAQWASLSAASGAVKLEIAVANTLRARAWGNTSPVPMPPWATKLFSGVDSTVAWPAILRIPIASMSGGSDTHYGIEDLYLVASEESRAQLLSGFQALPFSEPATGLVYAKARWYDPGTGAFLTPDPLGYQDSSNLYAFAGGDPINGSDPTGESATFVGGAIGFAWGVGWSAGSAINEGLIHREQWQGWGHYGSQLAMFTMSGAEIGASVDLVALGGGSVSSMLGGAGVDSVIAAFSGDWGGYGAAQIRGGAFGLGTWAAIKGAGMVPGVSAATAWIGNTALVGRTLRMAANASERTGLSYFGSELGRLSAKHGFDDVAGTSMGLWAERGIRARGLAAEDAVLGVRGKSWADPDRLPPGMDVLDAFGRNAHSVKSVDTTLRSVRTAGDLYKRVSREMYVLRELDDDIAKSGVRITREMLAGRQRVLTYVLPPNQPLSIAQRQGLSTSRALAGDLGLRLRIRFAKHVRTSWSDFLLK